MNSKPILYDLGVAAGAISLWLTPFDAARLLGYSISIVFAGDAYYRGITLLSQQRRDDEKEGVAYEAELDFYEQLLERHIDSVLEVKATELETKALERILPVAQYRRHLEQQLSRLELSEEEKHQAAKAAIEDALTDDSEITEEVMRKHFPSELDNTTWKAILKALQDGIDKEEIVGGVLGCNQSKEQIGRAYFEFLKQKFLP